MKKARMRRGRFFLLVMTIMIALFLAACGGAPAERAVESVAATTPIVESTVASSPTPSPTPTLAPSPTPSPSPTLTSTPTLTPTPTSTPGPTPDGIVRTARVPILMYHYISVPPADDQHPYRVGNSVDPATFAAHLDYLQEQGYTTIRLEDLLSFLATGQPELPEKPIILTFDDGYEDNYRNALPVLQAHGMTGTFFIITDYATGATDADPTYANYADWPQIKEMTDAGMEIGSHSRNHPNLAGKDVDYLVWQALGSQETITDHVGRTPHILSYPGGDYDQLTIDVFKSAHFWGAVTTESGNTHSSDKPFELRRVRISNTTGVPQLQALLDYDWPD